MASIIEDAVNKYSGGDDAYALKLKQGIRDSMGYSNYMARLGKESAVPASAPVSVKGKNITPQGIISGQEAGYGIQNRNIASLGRITGAMDTAAGSIASHQIAREKDAKDKMFEPKDWLDKQIRDFQLNRPKKEDGSEMTTAEFSDHLKGMLQGEGSDKDMLFQQGISPQVIDNRLRERMPKDFEQKRAYYQALAAGETKAVADDIQDRDDYINNKMSSGRKLVYELLNPNLKDNLVDPNDVSTVRDEQGGVSPKMQYTDLKKKYPKADEETLKKPYKDSLLDDASIWYEQNKKGVDEKMSEPNGFSDIMDDDSYKKLKNILSVQYNGVFTSGEIDKIIFEKLTK